MERRISISPRRRHLVHRRRHHPRQRQARYCSCRPRRDPPFLSALSSPQLEVGYCFRPRRDPQASSLDVRPPLNHNEISGPDAAAFAVAAQAADAAPAAAVAVPAGGGGLTSKGWHPGAGAAAFAAVADAAGGGGGSACVPGQKTEKAGKKGWRMKAGNRRNKAGKKGWRMKAGNRRKKAGNKVCSLVGVCLWEFVASAAGCFDMKDTLSIKEIQPHVRRWTALVQVVEKGHVSVSQHDSSISYCRFLFVDAEVSAVAYNNNIRTNAALLVPFKWCYVSGATLKKVDKKYLVGDYIYSWTINNNTLIQPCEEKMPAQLVFSVDLQEYKKLHSFADTDNLQNVLGVVVHSFTSRQIGEDSVSREIILVNEEKIPIMFTLWNDFATTEGSQLANNIHSASVVLALRVKVTTFNGISLSTRAPCAILINPPLVQQLSLSNGWYSQHKNEIDNMIGRAAYKDTTILIHYPSTDNVLSVHTMLSGIKNVRAAWIKGCVTLPHIQQSLWFSAYASCHKKFDLQTSSAIRCSSCSQNSMIEARARIPLEIADGTGILSAVVYGEDAERLIAYTAQQLQAAEDKGADLVATIRSAICGKHVVCFVRVFQAAELNKPLDANDKGVELDNIEAEDEVETQLFTPSAKACLEAILDEPTTMSTPKESKSAVVRSLLFENPETTAESLVATDNTQCS
ncbi:replication protein A 70 kDa DNA-binding subunit [Striga asiatica]|uniref:Replication protein A 70 kDa DNA-binding subunit n=1 Tax=Striga asiatica TaxID=4170 RepID=A0A5A7QTH7_STRAF|nr:replication protein A 70 kDa DNA-binding subunit [Striga asiatica]